MDRRQFFQDTMGAAAVMALAASAETASAAGPAGPGIPKDLLPTGSPARFGDSPIAFDKNSLIIDGKRRQLLAAEFHYFRAPDPAAWRDRIRALKECGFNAINVYYYWAYHSPEQGKYFFAGTRDVDRFHDIIEEEGMYLIARPGPYICAEVDGGGFPAWLLTKRDVVLRCKKGGKPHYDAEYMKYVREWYGEIIPRIVKHKNLVLLQTENEYNLMDPIPDALLKFGLSMFGPETQSRLSATSIWRNYNKMNVSKAMKSDTFAGHCQYLQELYKLAREFGAKVPLIHNDAASPGTRWSDVDIPGVDDYPISWMDEKWMENGGRAFMPIDLMETSLNALKVDCPLIVPEVQGGWYDGWGGHGYAKNRTALGPEAMDITLKSCLAQGARVISVYMAFGGTNWGYIPSPDVYTSYDYGSPITEGGAISARGRAVRPLADFVKNHEEDFCVSAHDPEVVGDNREVFVRARKADSGNTYLFLRNLSGKPQKVRLSNGQEFNLDQPAMTVVALDRSGKIVDQVGLARDRAEAKLPALSLPALSFNYHLHRGPLEPAFDDSGWKAMKPGERTDMDGLGFHYGFVWYRGTYEGAMPSFKLDARHTWAAYLDGELILGYDNFQNKLGVVSDLAKTVTVKVPAKFQKPGRHALVILTHSHGHMKGFMPDSQLPRGIAAIDTGKTVVDWRAQGGLFPGENGITPVINPSDLGAGQPVSLPHKWAAGSAGIGVYQTDFELHLPEGSPVGIRISKAPEKALIYLNGALIGIYWEGVGPQKVFFCPPPHLKYDGLNTLTVALWPWADAPEMGPVTLEVYP